MKQEEEKSVGLPDNAFRPLKPGEQYHPIMSPNKKYPEVNLWSVQYIANTSPRYSLARPIRNNHSSLSLPLHSSSLY